MNRNCAICGETRDLFILEFDPDDTDAGEKLSRFVCGKCWETIAKIAVLAVKKYFPATAEDGQK